MTTALSIAALVVSVGALIVSWAYGARSASAAGKSATEAEAVRKAELEREHRHYTPVLEDIEFPWERSREGRSSQFLTFRLSRTYQVFGDRVNAKDSLSSLGGGIGGALEAGVVYRIPLGYDDEHRPLAVKLRFFPPVEGDPGVTWSCPCERDAVPDVEKVGHWEIRETVPERL